MNKTQKGALIVLAVTILLSIFGITIPIVWFSNTHILTRFPLFLFVLTYIVMALSAIFLRKKQSSCEVDFDERDRIIKQKAIFASYITLWTLVFLGCTIPFFVTNQQGTIPVSLLPVALFTVFIIVMLAYSLTILVQYGWRSRGDQL